MTMTLKTALTGHHGSSHADFVNRANGWYVPRFQPPRSVKGWTEALRKIERDLRYAEQQMALDFEGRAIKRYSNHAMFPYAGTWHHAITFHHQRLMVALRAAQARFPGVRWGYPEEKA